jgi:hypothetical protein
MRLDLHRRERPLLAPDPDDRLMSPVYWKPKYGTRSSRHRAWVKQESKREAAAKRQGSTSLRQRLRKLFRR